MYSWKWACKACRLGCIQRQASLPLWNPQSFFWVTQVWYRRRVWDRAICWGTHRCQISQALGTRPFVCRGTCKVRSILLVAYNNMYVEGGTWALARVLTCSPAQIKCPEYWVSIQQRHAPSCLCEKLAQQHPHTSSHNCCCIKISEISFSVGKMGDLLKWIFYLMFFVKFFITLGQASKIGLNYGWIKLNLIIIIKWSKPS
jgi:hypothetical protein